MADVLKNILVLTLAGVLALPGGWCCRPVQAADDAAPGDPAPGSRACCRHENVPAAPDRAPAAPAGHCCCARDLNTPTERVAVTPIDLALSAPLALALDDAAGAACTMAATADPATGPPLYVLHCVWRC